MATRKLLVTAVLLATLVAITINFAAASVQTLTGVITDDMCGKKHTMLKGKPDAECVRACVKANSKYALLVGDKVYTLKGDAKQLDQLAAKKVKVTGDVSGTTIAITSITEAK